MTQPSEEVWRREEIASPCVKVCVIHPEAKICTGCLRTIDEIMAWGKMDNETRADIMAHLPDREDALKQRRGGRKARLASRQGGSG